MIIINNFVDVQTQRCLYIFAGERNRDHLNDIWLFHVDTNEVQHIADVYCKDSLRGTCTCCTLCDTSTQYRQKSHRDSTL